LSKSNDKIILLEKAEYKKDFFTWTKIYLDNVFYFVILKVIR